MLYKLERGAPAAPGDTMSTAGDEDVYAQLRAKLARPKPRVRRCPAPTRRKAEWLSNPARKRMKDDIACRRRGPDDQPESDATGRAGAA
jgi:hypothetical protein